MDPHNLNNWHQLKKEDMRDKKCDVELENKVGKREGRTARKNMSLLPTVIQNVW